MTARDYLQRPFRIKKRIESLKKDIARLEAVATNCSPNIIGMPHAPSATTSRMADVVCMIVDKQRELERLTAECKTVEQEIALLITDLENDEFKELLERRYVQREEWQDIADSMHYGISWIYQLHKKALSAFEKKLKECSCV